MRLVLLLLVKDEIDIIDANIRWHLGHGVDHIIVTDNGSSDGTTEVLRKSVKSGRITLIEDQSPYRQEEMTTRMARIASQDFGADWIISADADELWAPAADDLKSELRICDCSLLYVRTTNFIPTARDDLTIPCPISRMLYRVEHPIRIPRVPQLLKIPQRKAMFLANDLLRIHMGNHDADLRHPRKMVSSNIVIYHYPIRSRQQFFAKVSKGGAALARVPEYDARIAYHWRRWHRKLTTGKLEAEWQRLRPGPVAMRLLTATGVLTRDTSIRDAFQAL